VAWTASHVTGLAAEIQRRDTSDWRGTAAFTLTTPQPGGHIDFVLHPGGRAVAVWAAAGQGGPWRYWAHDEGAATRVSPPLPLPEPVPARMFHRAGGEFLVVEDCYTFRRYSFPDCRELGTLNWEVDEGDDEDEDGPVGSFCYLADDRALVGFEESGRLAIVDL